MMLLAVATSMQHFGWSLLITLAASAIFACAVALAKSAFQRSRTRYAVSLAGLLLMALLPIGAFAMLTCGWIPARTIWAASNSEPWHSLLWLVVLLWALGAGGALGIHAGGWLRLRAMVRRGRTLVSGPVSEAAADLSQRARIPAVLLVVDEPALATPVVLGALAPTILLPRAVASHAQREALRHLIAHELGHVARRDYPINCIQVLIESLLWFCPGLWWISSEVRLERECCCDEFAVGLCREPPGRYARTLLALDERRRRFGAWLAPASSGGDLAQRVFRLMGGSCRARLRRRLALGTCVTCAALVGALAVSPLFAAPIPGDARAAVHSDGCSAAVPAPPILREPAACK